MTKFAENISEAKDWCSYWEIDKFNKPAPADFTNDKAFWYNLNANLDLINACLRLYKWTGDKSYLESPLFINFYEKTLNEYLDRWQLNIDDLFKRESILNKTIPFDEKNSHYTCRGIPSYIEGVDGMQIGGDLVALLYKGNSAYGEMLKIRGNNTDNSKYESKALSYREHLQNFWWNANKQTYNAYLMENGAFIESKGDANPFIMWSGIVNQEDRIKTILNNIVSRNYWNVETASYLPLLFYRYGYSKEGYKMIVYLSDKKTKRREYPEVSFSVVESIITGLLGVNPDASKNQVSTFSQLPLETKWAEAKNIPMLGTSISVKQEGNSRTTFTNNGKIDILWVAKFDDKFNSIEIDDKETEALCDESTIYCKMVVQPGKTIVAKSK